MENLAPVDAMTSPAGLGVARAAPQQGLPAAATGRGPVCVVDDDDMVCESLTLLLQTQGFAVVSYGSGTELLRNEQQVDAKCLIIDQHMPGISGLDALAALRRKGTALPAILITGRPDSAISERARALGVRAVLEKPFRMARLVELIGGTLDPPP